MSRHRNGTMSTSRDLTGKRKTNRRLVSQDEGVLYTVRVTVSQSDEFAVIRQHQRGAKVLRRHTDSRPSLVFLPQLWKGVSMRGRFRRWLSSLQAIQRLFLYINWTSMQVLEVSLSASWYIHFVVCFVLCLGDCSNWLVITGQRVSKVVTKTAARTIMRRDLVMPSPWACTLLKTS